MQALEEERRYFEKLLDKHSRPQLHFVPEPGHWNILQVIDHIIKVERQTLKFLRNFDFARKDEKVGLADAIKFLLLKIALKSSIKFKVPTKDVIPEQKSAADLLSEWEVVRAELNAFLTNFPANKLQNFVFFHPRSGKLNILQVLEFLQEHIVHHKQQVRRISNNAGFPTS